MLHLKVVFAGRPHARILAIDASAHPLEESLAFEADKMALTGGTEDHRNAVDSFVAKQRPTFHGR